MVFISQTQIDMNRNQYTAVEEMTHTGYDARFSHHSTAHVIAVINNLINRAYLT